ncbi:MAG: MFS transporter [Robiginitomaculum sp.]|nr:MFS transporter [Robiginitomaculum sp.]
MSIIEGRATFLPSISEHRNLRFFCIFIMYVAQGVPVGLFFFAIPAWLAASGASALEIGGFVSATALPWSLKFINGFLMDRFAFLAMGRRRAWLIGAQIIMVIGLLALALANPSVSNITLLSAFSFAINAATTFQDVAIDGLAVDLVPDPERARANGLMFGGQSVGIAAGTAVTGYAIPAFGFPIAVLGTAGLVAFVLVVILIVRERPGERLLPWAKGQASQTSLSRHVGKWIPLFKNAWSAMLTKESILVALAMSMNGVAYGIYIGAMPMIATNIGGWTDAEFSALSASAALITGFLCIFVFGIFTDKVGTRRAAMLGFTAMVLLCLAMIAAQKNWASPSFIRGFAIGFLSLNYFLTVALAAAAMRLCSVKVAATQFTLYMAISNLGISFGGGFLGLLEAIGGYTAMLLGIIGASIIGFILIYMASRTSHQYETNELSR